MQSKEGDQFQIRAILFTSSKPVAFTTEDDQE
jgi:hypothetical protein